MLIFTLVIIKIFQYVDKLKKDICNLQENNNINIKEIYNEIINYKYIICNNVTNFNNIFNLFTIVISISFINL